MELEHLSYSSISGYQLCPKAWEYKYIQKIKTIATPSLVFGSAFHSAVESLIRARVNGDSVAPHEAWAAAWVKATEQEINWNGDRPEEHSNTGLRMLTHEDTQAVIASIKPLLEADEAGVMHPVLERKVELRVPDVSTPIIGYIDLILEDGTVCDFKTSARAWTPEKAAQETQPAYYMAALNQAGILNTYRARHYVFVKTKKPQVQTLDSRRTMGEIFGLLRTIRDVWRGIEAGSFPQNMGTWKCGPKYCDFYQMCRGA